MFSFVYYIEYILQRSILLVVMETKVSAPVVWLYRKFVEGIRLNFVLVSTKLIWTYDM